MSSLETKIDKMECQLFERDQLIDELQEKVRSYRERVSGLEEHVEDMERNSRSANLIFWSRQIGKRTAGEDITQKTIKLINDNFPTKSVTKADFSAVHRLSNENTVICAFVSKNLRNEIYDERLNLRKRKAEENDRLYINESLTKSKREIFSRLLEMKRQDRIWTAFTKNGIPCCKLTKESTAMRINSLQQFERLVLQIPAAAAPAGGARAGAGGRPPPSAPPTPRWPPGRRTAGCCGACRRWSGTIVEVRLGTPVRPPAAPGRRTAACSGACRRWSGTIVEVRLGTGTGGGGGGDRG